MMRTSAVVFAVLLAATEGAQPNIIIIIADDLGYNDVGFRGSDQSSTPNIDALAYNGIVLNRFYTQQSCTPSRAALLTGNYPMRTGLQGIPIVAGARRFLPREMPILPERLRELGYKTRLIGKWHLGSCYADVTPTGRGFDGHFGYWHGYVGYFNYYAANGYRNMTGLDLHDDFEPVWSTQGVYATETFTKKAVEFINDYNDTAPYFLVISHLAPHAGFNDLLEVPDIEDTNKKYGYVPDSNRRLSIETVNRLDQSIGAVFTALAQKGHLQNSVVLFLSDNGAQTFGVHQNFGSNWPLRGLKFTLYEGGVRGTAIIYSPLFKQPGTINNELIHITDLLPTLYAAAGGNTTDLGPIDGVNQWQTITENRSTKRTEILLEIDELQNLSGILAEGGRYKLINGTIFDGIYDQHAGDSGRGPENPSYNLSAILQSEVQAAIAQMALSKAPTADAILELRRRLDLSGCNGRNATRLECRGFCLFDVFEDPCETENVLEEKLEVFEELKGKLESYWKDVVPQGALESDVRADPKLYNNTWVPWLDRF